MSDQPLPPRRQRALERWEAQRTAPAAEIVRQRSRRLPSDADAAAVLEQNAWDDVEMDEEEVAAAEAAVGGQPLAPAEEGERCSAEAARRWDAHYGANLQNYKDRRYLRNEFPTLLEPSSGRAADEPLWLLETGCGVGNTLLPLLGLDASCRAIGCDFSPAAIAKTNERLGREGLAGRGSAFVWDIGSPPPTPSPLPSRGVDTCLAIFSLSALPPFRLASAFAQLAACLRPGGQLLLRDYGRLDLKQLKFAQAKGSSGRLGVTEHGCEWYARGDGTTAVFLTPEAVASLAASAGLHVASLGYDRRLLVNRASGARMHRVWIVGRLTKPADAATARAPTPRAAHEDAPTPWYSRPLLVGAAVAALAACGLAAYRALRGAGALRVRGAGAHADGEAADGEAAAGETAAGETAACGEGAPTEGAQRRGMVLRLRGGSPRVAGLAAALQLPASRLEVRTVPPTGDCLYDCMHMQLPVPEFTGKMAHGRGEVRSRVREDPRLQDAGSMRDAVAEAITEEVMETYKVYAMAGVEGYEWLSQAHTLEDVRKFAKRRGKDAGANKCLWADEFALQTLSKVAGLLFLIFDDESAPRGSRTGRKRGGDVGLPDSRFIAVGEPSRHCVFLHRSARQHYSPVLLDGKGLLTIDELPQATRQLWSQLGALTVGGGGEAAAGEAEAEAAAGGGEATAEAGGASSRQRGKAARTG